MTKKNKPKSKQKHPGQISNNVPKDSNTKPEKEKFEWSLRNKKLTAAIPFAIAVVLYLLIWTEPGEPVLDPWFEAVKLIDSSRKESDPALKKELLDKAGNDLRSLVNKHPYHARVHFLMGYYYSNTNKWDSAISEFEETIRIDSGSTINPVAPDAINQLCIAVIKKCDPSFRAKKFEEALEILRPASRFRNYNAEINVQYAMIYHYQGKLDLALKHYDKALTIKPNLSAAVRNASMIALVFGNNFMTQKKYDQAMEYYQRSAKYNPNNPDLYNNLAMLYEQTNQIDKALESLKKAISLEPSHKRALQNLVKIYTKSGDRQNANFYRQKLASLN